MMPSMTTLLMTVLCKHMYRPVFAVLMSTPHDWGIPLSLSQLQFHLAYTHATTSLCSPILCPNHALVGICTLDNNVLLALLIKSQWLHYCQ